MKVREAIKRCRPYASEYELRHVYIGPANHLVNKNIDLNTFEHRDWTSWNRDHDNELMEKTIHGVTCTKNGDLIICYKTKEATK
jgi:hypothetical protein